MKYKKSVAVWKICKRSFKCDVAGGFSFIHLEMAQEWMKTLPYLILQFNCIQKVLIRSSSLWRALTFKRFELQIWDWSWMKENSKTFGLLQSWPTTLYPYVISKRKKLQQPAWSHFEALLKSFKTVTDFAMFFSLDVCEKLLGKNRKTFFDFWVSLRN